jgi:hypothetical protein|tara:strand:- start:431 stop:931 length:501 start_codon:yes stop_codon:yes gene_type:complete
MDPLEIKPQLECHCCTSNECVFICELDNCEYPLCSTCKEKVLEIEHKCPGCRRNIVVDIEEDGENIYLRNKCCYYEYKIVNYLFTIITNMIIIIIGVFLGVLSLLVGRIISIILAIGPGDFWCESTGQYYIVEFISSALSGFLIGVFILCCCGGLFRKCVSYELDD